MGIHQWVAIIGTGGILCLIVGIFVGNVVAGLIGVLGIAVLILFAARNSGLRPPTR
jgi:hypothetical protein